MTPKLHLVSLVLDGMPFLSIQLNTFNRINTSLVDWTWHIVHGAAANTGSTSWCKPQQPRLSNDGSTELLATWAGHPRIRIYQKPFWAGGKDAMMNEAMKAIQDPGVLLQVDIDELWTPEQLEVMVGFFSAYDQINAARFFCRYYVGPNIVITSTNGYGNRPGEWLRAFRFHPGMRFLSHEPPRILGAMEPCATREQTKEVGLVFDHWSWVFEKTVEYKQNFYGYPNAVLRWKNLQANKIWPRDLKQMLPWVGPNVVVDKLFK